MLYSDGQRFCDYCINPADLGVLNPTTGKILNFHSGNDDLFCEICYETFRDNKFPERSYFDQEWNDYLSARPKLLFAYSGGLDSRFQSSYEHEMRLVVSHHELMFF